MALLHAASRVCPESVVMVATFDHGTGAAATRAASLVANESAALGFPCVIGTSSRGGATEGEWRAKRLAFLDDVARPLRARVATAHTRDDQIETVVMRVMRDAGARGLAGLYASAERVRPLLDVTRAEVAAYASALGAAWIEDSTNTSTRHLRNRVRRDLLPAIRNAAPGFETQVLAIARDAAAWRRDLDRAVSSAICVAPRRDGLAVATADLAGFSQDALAVLWPAIAARVGVVTDWRGIRRAAAFTIHGRVGARVQLSDGWTLSRSREAFELRREHAALPEATLALPRLEWGAWVFRSLRRASAVGAWQARLPAGRPLTVRVWRPGDRMETDAGAAPRRVTRLLSDAGVSGHLRAHWPVVLAGERIVWIPGIRQSPAATVRPGPPGVLFACDFHDR